jgi:hypothetical protein
LTPKGEIERTGRHQTARQAAGAFLLGLLGADRSGVLLGGYYVTAPTAAILSEKCAEGFWSIRSLVNRLPAGATA